MSSLKNGVSALLLLWGLSSWPCSPSLASADSTLFVSRNEDASRSAFEAGRRSYEHGDFGEALVHFEASYRLSPRPELLYNIGRAADSDGEPSRAIAAYSAYLDAAADAENRDFVEARLSKMRALVERQNRDARPSSSLVRLEASTPRGLSTTLPSRDDDTSTRSFWRRPWVWLTLGAVVAGAVTASVLATRAEQPERTRADAYILTPEPR